MNFQTLLWSVFLPGSIALGLGTLAAAVLFVGRVRSDNDEKSASEARGWPFRGVSSEPLSWRDRFGRALLGLAFVLPPIASFWSIEGWPGLPPHARWQWLLMIVAWAGGVGVLSGMLRDRLWTAPIIALVLAVPAGLMLQPLPMFAQPWMWKVGLMAAIVVLFLSLHLQSAARRGGWMPLAMMILFTAAAMVIVEARFAKLALISSAMAAGMGCVFVIGLVARRLDIRAGPVAVVATFLPALMALGWFYNEGSVPAASFLLLAASPLGLWLAEVPVVRRQGWAVRGTAWLLAAVLIPAAAVVLSMVNSDPPPSLDDYYGSNVTSQHGVAG